MNILFLAHRVPYPPNKGDKLRAFNILRHLSRKHKIWLACISETKYDLKYQNELKKYCQKVDIVVTGFACRKIKSMLYLFSNKPLTLPYFYSAKLYRKIKEIITKENFDLIFIYSSSMAQYVSTIKNIPKIIDFIDVDSEKWKDYSDFSNFLSKIIYVLESNRLRSYEKKLIESCSRSIVTSNEEVKVFQTFVSKGKIEAVSNGVDFEYFKPVACDYKNNQLIFTGVMDYFANVDGILYFHKEILPLIKKEVPDVKLFIVGAHPTNEIKRLANEEIIVTGFVEDVRPYLERSAVCVAPLRIARGIQNKILEAMAMGVPVVATNKASKGIKATAGEHILVEDEPTRFAHRTIELLKDRDLRDRISKSARRLIEENYSWDTNLKVIDNIIEQSVKNNNRL